MNFRTQEHLQALISSLASTPNHLDDIARDERSTSDKAADDLCRAAELIRHAIGRLEMAARSPALERPTSPAKVSVDDLGVVNQLRQVQVYVAKEPLNLYVVP